MRKLIALFLVLVFLSLTMAGCGETFSGAGKDTRRISKGIKTIFVRGE